MYIHRKHTIHTVISIYLYMYPEDILSSVRSMALIRVLTDQLLKAGFKKCVKGWVVGLHSWIN